MAVFFVESSFISRGKGQSAVAAAAYRHATQMKSALYGRTNNYSTKRNELIHSEIALPENAPAWTQEAFGEEAFQKALAEVRGEAASKGHDLTDSEAERAA